MTSASTTEDPVRTGPKHALRKRTQDDPDDQMEPVSVIIARHTDPDDEHDR